MKQAIKKQNSGFMVRCTAALVVSQLWMCAASAEETGIPVHGFADVGYTHASNNETRLNQAGRGFWANSLDFYLTPQFNDRSKALIELIFEFAPDGGLATDLERIQLGYTFNDQLTTWAGRFHAPYGYWNTGFHHGAEIQTAISRPRFIDFEDKGGLLPAHVMGAWATGQVGMGASKLTYDLYTGNGNAIEVGKDSLAGSHDGTLAINNSRDSNGSRLVGANIAYNLGGLVVGTHAFMGRTNILDTSAPPAATSLGEVGVKMTGLYGFYEDDNWEAITEYYRFNNDNLNVAPASRVGSGSHSSWLGFAQVAHTFGNLSPYVRVERASLDQEDPYFTSQAYGISYSRQALGVRYMLNDKAALKFEANQTKEGDAIPTSGTDNGNYNEVRVQYSIRF